MTLACEDDQRLEANKVILAATSPFLDDMLFVPIGHKSESDSRNDFEQLG